MKSIIYSFGRNSAGQLGFKTKENHIHKPTKVENKSQVTNLVSGFGKSLFASGRELVNYGSYTKTRVSTFQLEPILEVACGHSHFLILTNTTPRRVYALGNNETKAFGKFISREIVLRPIELKIPKYINVGRIYCNNNSNFILSVEGDLYGFGSGNLGYQPSKRRPLALQQVTRKVRCVWTGPSSDSVFFQKKDSKIFAFGDNKKNALGAQPNKNDNTNSNNSNNNNNNNNNNNKNKKKNKNDKKNENENDNYEKNNEKNSSTILEPIEIKVFRNKEVWQMAAGQLFSLALIEGKVWSVGDKHFAGHSTTKKLNKWNPISALQDYTVIQMACGSNHSIVLTDHNRLFLWGNSWFDQLGIEKGSISGQKKKKNNKSIVQIPIELKLESSLSKIGSEIYLNCGYFNTYVWSPSRSSVALDLLKSVETAKDYNRLVNENLTFIERRLSTELSQQSKQILLAKVSQPRKQTFLKFIFTGILPTTDYCTIRQVYKEMKIACNFKRHSLMNDLYFLYNEERTKDYFIILENQNISVHKFILKARTSLLNQNTQQKQNPTCNAKATKLFIKFLYTDEIEIKDCNMHTLKQLSKDKNLFGLSEQSLFKFQQELDKVKFHLAKPSTKIKNIFSNTKTIYFFLFLFFFYIFYYMYSKLFRNQNDDFEL
ncbi:hypothetical protein M0813_00142 [Anaeramoeba flamelloides]|uniref:BTB domain-containing protein n=1 Tax=Anaeramoeba flamelloides TaxID=1746091 RepID=A0ABQ8YX45_9EUKA|nr:hypothetical protein M0813_00142 [Anaeramoeba flamelloides]